MFAFRKQQFSKATAESKFKIVQFQANDDDDDDNVNDHDNDDNDSSNIIAAIQNGANINVRKNFSLTNFEHGHSTKRGDSKSQKL